MGHPRSTSKHHSRQVHRPVIPIPTSGLIRRCLDLGALLLCALLPLRAIGVDPYGVPTGSMAPTLLGEHTTISCPHCRFPIAIGASASKRGTLLAVRAPDDCPNCGQGALGTEELLTTRGDHVLVNKTVFDLRRPRRWEPAVFRHPATPELVFLKRVVGLPGESVQIKDGDLWIDQELARKTLDEARAIRVPVVDLRYVPGPGGWSNRWVREPLGGAATVEGAELQFLAEDQVDSYEWLIYRHGLGTSSKARPVFDEYAYNGREESRSPEPVHDFFLECEVEVSSGEGWLALALGDGSDEMIAELPLGSSRTGTKLSLGRPSEGRVLRVAPEVVLESGKTWRVEFAFVDRRASLAVNGREIVRPVDRPEVENRSEVVRPMRIGVRGARVTVRNLRLFRDVHYAGLGPHLTREPYRLGAREYLVLGDNSANSEDSRYWSASDGQVIPVPQANFLGKPFLVLLPRHGGTRTRLLR